MFSLVDEALSAIQRINPNAQLLCLVECLKLYNFREGCHSFWHFGFLNLLNHPIFELWTSLISEILLRNNIETVLSISLFEPTNDEVLDKVINLHKSKRYLSDRVILALPAHFRVLWELMQKLAGSGDQIDQI